MLSLRPFLPTWSNAAKAVRGTLEELQARITGTRSRLPHVLPSFLIIGAQRSGTTSLYNYLVEHPSIAPAAMKEVHFFDVHFQKGLGWYRNQFRSVMRGSDREPLTGEASPYYLFHPLAANRVATVLPDAKLIVLLRNPVDRALSHYHYMVRRGYETLSFPDALAAEEGRLKGETERISLEAGYQSKVHQRYSYRSRGCYVDQLERWSKFFPRENMLILFSERFYRAPADTLRKVYAFLGLPSFSAHSTGFPVHNQGSYPDVESETRDDLERFYRSHNQRLAEYLKEKPGWESK